MDEKQNALDDTAFCHRVALYLDNSIPANELRTLNVELQNDAGKRSIFAQMCFLKAALVFPGCRITGDAPDQALPATDSFFAQHDLDISSLANIPDLTKSAEASSPSMEDAVILPGLKDTDDEVEPETDIEMPEPIPLPQQSQALDPRNQKRWWISGLSGAAILLLGLLIWSAFRPAHSVVRPLQPSAPVAAIPFCATVTASASGMCDTTTPIDPGLGLAENGSLHVDSGAVELMLAKGTRVVITGPADLRVTDANAIKLTKGSIVAYVPVQAHGFKAEAPGLVIVDLGTEFGLHANTASSESDVCVFQGAVRVAGVDATGQPVGAPVLLSADHAMKHSEWDSLAPAVADFDASAFNRAVEQFRVDVTTHGTGEGVTPGSDDPAWRIMSVPGDPAWIPKPAMVLSKLAVTYAANSSAASWISTTSDSQNAAPGTYVYETSIDLSGFDAGTISSAAVVAVDDSIAAIKVNDIPTDLKPDPVDRLEGRQRTLPFTSHAWHSGMNKVTVVVTNRDDGLTSGGNPTGVQLRWVISAQPYVKR